jgi:kynurenine formamidase
MAKRWQRRPDGSNWGEFGPDDERGRLNLLTPAKVREGLAEAREGLTFCLSLPLDRPGGNKLNPRRHPPRLMAARREDRRNYNYPLSREDPRWSDVVCDDAVLLWTQYSTQWDALSHVGAEFDADGDGRAEAVFYNGFRAGEDVLVAHEANEDAAPLAGPVRAGRLGIENMATACVQGRGVMIDFVAAFGPERRLIGYDELAAACAAQQVAVEPGDMVCLHTGFATALLAMDGEPDLERLAATGAVLDGSDQRLLRWVDESGLVALIADNYAVEALPGAPSAGRHPFLPLHELCLFKLGIHLGELWYLHDLAGWLRHAGRSRFLLTAPPLRLPGAVGSPVTPVATV